MNRSSQAKIGFDWVTLSLYLSLVIIGWLMLYATSYNEFQGGRIFGFDSTVGKQTIWIGLSLFVFLCSMAMDWKFWDSLSYPIYGVSILLLIGVLIVGIEIKGARAWYSVAGFSFQPSEFAKFGTCLALASYLSFFKTNLNQFKHLILALAMFILPSALILLQPDAGSALIFFSFAILFFRKGLSPGYFIISISFVLACVLSLVFHPLYILAGILLILLFVFMMQLEKKLIWSVAFMTVATAFIILLTENLIREAYIMLGFVILMFAIILWQQRKRQIVAILFSVVILLGAFSFGTKYAFDHFLKPHQQDRINVWLNPSKSDPQGSLYNIMQSKLAIGSGGIEGKGFLKGTMTKLNYVPEQSTDFIFSTIGEEQGFLGALGIIALYTILLLRIIAIGERAKYKFIQYYSYGFAGILFVHYFINIGMTMGIMPVIGIPLPFISKGGSSLLIFSIMMGVLLRMDLARFRRNA